MDRLATSAMNTTLSNPIVLDDLRLSRRWVNHSYLQPGLRHDLAGPQNALSLHVQLLSRAAAKGELEVDRVRRWVGVLETELGRLHRLAEISSGILAPDRADSTPAPVGAVWSTLHPLLGPRAKELGLRLEATHDEGVTMPVSVRQLEDLMLDLTVESMERREREGAEGRVEWTARRDGGAMTLTRWDDAAEPPADGGDAEITRDALFRDPAARPRLIVSKALAVQTRGRWAVVTDDGGHRITIRWPSNFEEGS